MFTGLIQTLGTVVAFDFRRLSVRIPSDIWPEGVQVGESVAVNGCCLTAVATGAELAFELSEETLARTALSDLVPGSAVNLERALRVGDRLGGHFVQGHVDGVGALLSRTARDGWHSFRFRIPDEGAKFLIDKGSIAIDGVSLTVVSPSSGDFDVAVIPHTLAETNLGELAPGARVNVEYDVLAKHVAKLLASS